MMMRMAKTYLSAPESFEAANDDWNDYVQRFKHFLLANRVTESSQKLHLFLTLTCVPMFKLL